MHIKFLLILLTTTECSGSTFHDSNHLIPGLTECERLCPVCRDIEEKGGSPVPRRPPSKYQSQCLNLGSKALECYAIIYNALCGWI